VRFQACFCSPFPQLQSKRFWSGSPLSSILTSNSPASPTGFLSHSRAFWSMISSALQFGAERCGLLAWLFPAWAGCWPSEESVTPNTDSSTAHTATHCSFQTAHDGLTGASSAPKYLSQEERFAAISSSQVPLSLPRYISDSLTLRTDPPCPRFCSLQDRFPFLQLTPSHFLPLPSLQKCNCALGNQTWGPTTQKRCLRTSFPGCLGRKPQRTLASGCLCSWNSHYHWVHLARWLVWRH